jgi:hypothetical protein
MPNGSILQMTSDATVEHILPKAGGAAWEMLFPDKAMRAEAANLLGNLTLLTEAQNTACGAKGYADKRKIFFNTPNAPIHALTRDLVGIEDWTMRAIEERHERLVRILCEDWGLIRDSSSQAA